MGECKWSEVTNASRLRRELVEKATKLPFYQGEPIRTILFARELQAQDDGECWTPRDVLEQLIG
ncbi:hypothetical protein [Neolewinella sp.]|uniref:hypothetical protein n=1 Tax=Neolewinella sp. TaxID=2993543 RepID=UPI003B521465